MDFKVVADVALTVGLPVLGAALVPGPLGGMIGGAVGGAIGGYLDAKVHGENSADTLTDTVMGAALGGLGGRLGGKLGAKLLDKIAAESRAGWRPANRIARFRNTFGPSIPQAVLAGAGSGFARSVSNKRERQTSAAEVPEVRKPAGLAPKVDALYNELPGLFGQASSVLGGPGPATKYTAAPVKSSSTLRAPQGRSGIDTYDATRRSLDGTVAATDASDRQVADAVRVAAASSAAAHTTLANTVDGLNRHADASPRGIDPNTFALTALDRAVGGTQQILADTQAAGAKLAATLPA
ncbi:hypothetical protein [Nocardia blacklockiae]|uniref:hypothetical protein n=1 Tax=Nocardia blacklockiae TaxID=480036 RepID=UPI0018948328|nr:hypothetical protein [Nocardia blacklockiae]MBF6170444.1 hypothetical protein [Nocardia blacklockiae]